MLRDRYNIENSLTEEKEVKRRLHQLYAIKRRIHGIAPKYFWTIFTIAVSFLTVVMVIVLCGISLRSLYWTASILACTSGILFWLACTSSVPDTAEMQFLRWLRTYPIKNQARFAILQEAINCEPLDCLGVIKIWLADEIIEYQSSMYIYKREHIRSKLNKIMSDIKQKNNN